MRIDRKSAGRPAQAEPVTVHPGWGAGFRTFKRGFDLVIGLALLPMILLVSLVLTLLNPFLNPGPLLYSQQRMGRDCEPFRAWKFRTMTDSDEVERGPFDAVEHHRITPLGRMLRTARLDELPQVFNVLAGQMSLIGPRPDFYDHAVVYLEHIPGYRARHFMRPGISGYAQITCGYVEDKEDVQRKVDADLHYLHNAGIGLDLWITWRTLETVLFSRGK